MKYSFDLNKGVFSFKDAETGKDWSNHFFNDLGYVMSVSHLGVANSKYVNSESIQVVLNDFNNERHNFVYIRDEETKKYWNTSGYPSLNKISNYKCEHGQQYTTISSKSQGIASSVTYAIAEDDTREVWEVTLTNKTDRERKLSLFATTSFDLNGSGQSTYFTAWTTTETVFLDDAQAVFARNCNPCRPHELSSGYIMSSEKVKAYEGNFEKFIGTMGTVTKPLILEKGMDCTNSCATVRTKSGILQNEIILKPNETKTVYYILGFIENEEKLVANRQKFVDECSSIIANAKNGHERYGHLKTKCPEEQFNTIMNYWAEHQVSYCMLGKKAVRDNAQLAMAMLNFNLDIAKKTIDECVIHQYSDGHAVLTWYPYLEPNIYSDPSTWLVFAICGYVKESGDFSYLDKVMAYLDGGEDTVYNHLKQAVSWFRREDNYGVNGLPRIHHADWNDALNIPDEKAESVMLSMLICKVYTDIIELAEHIGDTEYAELLKTYRTQLKDTINAVAFNGEYYVRAFSKYGVVGDKTCENGGKIYVNPQSWSIIADVCPEDRLESVVSAMDGMETEYGIPMCTPSYKTYDKSVGRMSGMLEGVFENGGIYNHAGCFKAMADCKLGRGDSARNILSKIIPNGKYNPSTLTTTEPYVFTNCYLKHPSVDMMVGFAWQTGTSAWGLMCYYEGILGLHRGYDGLHIEPALPKSWDKVEAQRYFRGNKLLIKYINKGGNKVSLKIDGKAIEGSVVPLFDDNDTHTVTVTLD